MRGCLVVFAALIACTHEAPVATTPKGPTPCARASDNMIQVLPANQAAKEASQTEAFDELRNMIRERCEQDSWSAEATDCLIKMKTFEDAEACSKLMTEDQQAALVRDEKSKFGEPSGKKPEPAAAAQSDTGAATTGAAPAGQPAPAPPPPASESPDKKSSKPKGNGKTGDPCEGGE